MMSSLIRFWGGGGYTQQGRRELITNKGSLFTNSRFIQNRSAASSSYRPTWSLGRLLELEEEMEFYDPGATFPIEQTTHKHINGNSNPSCNRLVDVVVHCRPREKKLHTA